MRMLGVVGIGSKQKLDLIFFYHLEDVVELRFLKLRIKRFLFFMRMAKTFAETKLNLIVRIKQQNRRHNIESLTVGKVNLPAAFSYITHSSNDEGQVKQPLEHLYHLARMLLDGLLEELFEIVDKGCHHVLFVEEYLGLGEGGLFVFSCCYF